eukprot:2821664-Pleurochrysis_carterae.AAC.3
MEITRSSLVASGAPIGFWDYAVTHAVDIPNRTCGPPNTNASVAYSKTRMKPRVWVGVNLRRSVPTPGAYHVCVPSAGCIVVTSRTSTRQQRFNRSKNACK